MAWVYILRGSSGRHYIGSAVDLDARFAQHLRGHTATTKRLVRYAWDRCQERSADFGWSSKAGTFLEEKEESSTRNLWIVG